MPTLGPTAANSVAADQALEGANDDRVSDMIVAIIAAAAVVGLVVLVLVLRQRSRRRGWNGGKLRSVSTSDEKQFDAGQSGTRRGSGAEYSIPAQVASTVNPTFESPLGGADDRGVFAIKRVRGSVLGAGQGMAAASSHEC